MNTIGFPNTDIYQEHEKGGEESFWPSFTDIMMVIVMTFLLIAVTVILQNWQLIKNLQESMKAEQMAALEAQSTLRVLETREKENETLEQRLTRLEGFIAKQKTALAASFTREQQTLQSLKENEAMLASKSQALQDSESRNTELSSELQQRQQEVTDAEARISSIEEQLTERQQQVVASEEKIKTVEEQLAQRQQQVDASLTRIREVEEELAQRQQQVDASQEKVREVEAELEQRQQQISTSEARLKSVEEALQQQQQQTSDSETRVKEVEEQLQQKQTALSQARQQLETVASSSEQLQQQITAREDEIEELRSKQREGYEQLESLQGEYDVLDKKYQKLLRPARSETGKYVVRILFDRGRRGARYAIKDQGDSDFSSMSKRRLHESLKKLKEQHGDDLYLKIIIPESSGLSHNEVWRFTQEMLNAYDYYYQDEDKL